MEQHKKVDLFGNPIKEKIKWKPKGKGNDKPNRYESLGLDTKKTSYDRGKRGMAYCPWCQEEKRFGFSLCFVNWTVCKECIEKAIPLFEKAHPHIKKEECFKCRLANKVYLSQTAGLQVGICLECLNFGRSLLCRYDTFCINGQYEFTF